MDFPWRIDNGARFLGPNLEDLLHIAQGFTVLQIFKRVLQILGQRKRVGFFLEISSCIFQFIQYIFTKSSDDSHQTDQMTRKSPKIVILIE